MGVYGREPQRKNFVYQLADRLCGGKQMKVPNDQEGNATYTPDLARAVVRLVELGESGIWNLAGPEPRLNRVVFARLVCEVLGLPKDGIEGVSTKELGQAAPRPLQGGLVTENISRVCKFRPAREGLLDWVAREPDSTLQP